MFRPNQTSYTKFQKHLHLKEHPSAIEEKLWKKCETYIPLLRFIPGILFVGVGNSLSMNACHENSDIDLFIITRKNRLWTVRILTTLYFTILGQRKTSKKHAGTFCLSFFMTESALDFSSFALENDIYLYFWIVFLKPLINKENIYEKFLEANNSWADFSGYDDILEENKKYLQFSSSIQEIKNNRNIFGGLLENILKAIFLPKTQKSFLKLGKPFGVIIRDDILKFHDRDRREEISSYFSKKNLHQ